MLLKGQKDKITLKLTAKVEQDAGKTMPVRFTATYKKPSIDEMKELIDSFKNDEGRGDLDVARDWIIDFSGILYDNDEPVEFTLENLDFVMDVREYRKALLDGLGDILYGKDKAKNS